MKKLFFILLTCLIGFFGLQAQPTQLANVNFESGIPSDWTVSNAANVQAISTIASTGSKCVRMTNSSSGVVTLTSPIYTRTAGCNVRLEFSHIPMLQNPSGEGCVEISTDNGGTWTLLAFSGSATSPTGYDYTYGGGVNNGSAWDGYFKKIDYWTGNTNVPESQLTGDTCWKNEVFYLTSTLGTSTTFRIRFKLAATSAVNTFSGWYLDDIRLSQAAIAGNTVRVPQLFSLDNYPNIYNYPNCADIPIAAQIRFRQSNAPSISDSIYIEYKIGTNDSIIRNPVTYNASTQQYQGTIEFNGYNDEVKWRLVINDEKYNRLTYPYTYGHWNRYKNTRPYRGYVTMATTGLSSQEIMMKTNQIRNLYQFRYTAAELQALHVTAGKIGGLIYNVTQATSGFTMQGFKVFMARIPSSTVLATYNQYPGPYETMISNMNVAAPTVGWHQLTFDEGKTFIWDGTSDILIKMCWDNGVGSSVGGTTKIQSYVAGSNSLTHQAYSSSGYLVSCNSDFNTDDATLAYKPNFKFNFIDNCVLPLDVGIYDTLIAPPYVDSIYNTYKVVKVDAATAIPTNVWIHNYGSDIITMPVQVSYSVVNGSSSAVPVITGNYTNTILPGNNGQYSFPTAKRPTFSFGYNYMKIWTDLLPPDVDWEPLNDTSKFEIVACSGGLTGTYSIGTVTGVASDRKFNSFKEMFAMIKGCGLAGPVTVKIANLPSGQYYTDTLNFPKNIPGASATNTITFVSGSATPVVLKPSVVVNNNIDLSGCKYLKFENIAFTRANKYVDTLSGEANIVEMSPATSYIEFKKCIFTRSTIDVGLATIDTAVTDPKYMLKINGANYITVDSCTFNGIATEYDIYAKGPSTNNATQGIIIKRSTFTNNITNAIYAEYTKNLTIEKNKFVNNVTGSVSGLYYEILLQNSYDFNVVKNYFLLSQINAIGLSNVVSSANSSVVANNKISITNNNTLQTITLHISGIQLISGDNVMIAYNNVYGVDNGLTTHYTYGLNLGTTGQTVSNIRAKNNIVVSDGAGFAVYARPTQASALDLSNNVYYKKNTYLSTPTTVTWKYNSTICSTLTDWQTTVGSDSNSYYADPLFASWDVLNTSNTFLCYKALPLAEVTNDFDSVARPSTNPCIGAVQFNPPPSNVYVKSVWIDRGDASIAADGTTTYSACGLGSEYVKVKFSNISVNSISPNLMKLWLKVDNAAVPVSQKDTISFTILSDTDYVYTFRLPYNFNVTSTDHKYALKVFSVLTADTVHSNDTASCFVLSRHQLSALASHTDTINYGDSILMNITSNDSIYWFLNSTSNIPALKSHSYQTSRLFSDTTFYFSRKEEIPVLKISEIQFSKTSTSIGQTVNLPSWLTVNNAIEISNYGSGAVNLKNYTLSYVTGNSVALSDIMSKSAIFGDYILPANSSVVLQLATGSSSDSSAYFYIGSGTTFNYSAKAGFILRNASNTIIDAVTINNATFNSTTAVPTTVWHGSGKMVLVTNTAGIKRNSASAADSTGWSPSTAVSPLTIGTIDPTQNVYVDNGCYGYLSSYHIVVNGVPSVDPGLAGVSLAGITKSSACTLTDQQVQVKITNTGVVNNTETPIKVLIYSGSNLLQTLEDTCYATVAPNDTVTYVLTPTAHLTSNDSNTTFRLIAFSNLSSDVIRLNDTTQMTITSLRTPYMPIASNVTIPYATSTILSATPNGNNTDIIIWYNSPTSHTELGRTTCHTPVLYEADTFYVESMLMTYDTLVLGSETTMNTQTAYPAPFNPSTKKVKEQYLFKSSEIAALGLSEGNINNIMFHIGQITAATVLADYSVKIGTTTDESLTAWKTGLTELYNDTIRLATTDTGWISLPFTTPYYYDGTSNLVVQICFASASSGSPKVRSYYSTTDFNSSLYYINNTTDACDYVGSPVNSNHTRRPNVKFSVDKFGCPSVRKPVVVNVVGSPLCDAGLSEFISPSSTVVMSGVATPIKVRLKNYGNDTLTTATINWRSNGVLQTPISWTGNILPSASDTVNLGSLIFTSGNNNLTAWVSLACDTISNNDTTSFDFSSCVGNNTSVTTLTIGGTGADYATISSAVSALVTSGICGDVIFNINPKTDGYNEQIFLPEIVGTDSYNITFKGNATDSTSVVLKYNAGTNTDQAAIKLNGAKNVKFQNLTIESYANTYSSVVDITNSSSNITFESMVVKSTPKTTPATETIKLIRFDGANNNITFNKVHFYGGATGIYAPLPEDTISRNLIVRNCFFDNFAFSGANLNGFNNLQVKNNKFREYANANISTALSLSNLSGLITVTANNIYLQGGSAVRTGCDIKRATATQYEPMEVSNNAISLSGLTTTTSLAYIGMNIDTVDYANIYYNTIRVKASNNSVASKVLNIGKTCTEIKVVNNNFDNEGKGTAYYVASPATQVVQSNYNNIYTTGTIVAFWGSNKATLDLLQTASLMDGMSLSITNPFVSDSNLYPLYPYGVARAALPLDEVAIDLLGNFRPIAPRPTIGAYEYQYDNIDVGPIAFLSPLNTMNYIENLPITVSARVKNFGLFSADTIQLTAVLKFKQDTTNIVQTRTQTFYTTLTSLSETVLTLNNPLYPPLNCNSITDSMHLFIYTSVRGDVKPINDTLRINFLTIPGYDVQAFKTVQITNRCNMDTTTVQMIIKNVGENTITANDSIWVNYQVAGRPELYRRELFRLPYTDDVATYDSLTKSQQITYTFQQKANFYPLGTTDTTWQLRTFVYLAKDNVRGNDTSAYTTVYSKVSPNPPITYDTSIYYGTWAIPRASQVNSFALKWYSDSTATPFYSPTNYATSTRYATTQLFTDSIFFIRVNATGTYPCISHYTPLHVTMRDRVAYDGACTGLQNQGVAEPIQEGWVYMTSADTVKVKVANYGTTAMQNFNVSYCIKVAGQPDSTIVTENCAVSVSPDSSYIYKFNTFANFSDPNATYILRAWIDVPGDIVHQNDTSLYWYVRPKNGNTVYPPVTVTNPATSLDITRVQLGNMDNSSNNTGLAYSDFTQTATPATLFKGIYDSMYVYCEKSALMEGDDSHIGGWVRVFIDWNRDGVFATDGTELALSDTIYSGGFAKGKIVIPTNALSGYTRMRVMLYQGKNSSYTWQATEEIKNGEVEDYKVFVRDTWDHNAELVKFTSPNEFLESQVQDVKIVLRNTGKTPMSSATIHWTRNDGDEQVYNWTGTMASAGREVITLASSMTIPTGMNVFKAWVDINDDPYHANDTIKRSSYIFKIKTAPYNCTFDENGESDDFYAYNNNPQIPTNCWQFGIPDSTNNVIKGPYSIPNCWKTKLSGKYPANNESMLYSPIFNIGVIKADTLSFRMKRALNNTSYVYVEYKNWNDKWVRLGITGDTNALNWYNGDTNRFTGSKDWTLCQYPMSIQSNAGNLGSTVQFRFVFHSGDGNTSDGVAIDDISLHKARREKDLGVVAMSILPTELPNYGSTFYPKVAVKNYGYGDVSSFTVCYTAEDMHIPQCEDVYQTIAPNDTLFYTFNNGHYINVEVSNPFTVCAFTRLNPTDLYSDNDSLVRQVVVGPLNKDVALLDITAPEAQVVSNNAITVSIRIKNMGIDPVTTLPVGYKISGSNVVNETIVFPQPLYNNEVYIYTFNTRYMSSYGAANLKVWVGLEGDYYHDNDTLYERVTAVASTRDVEARNVIIDDYGNDSIGVQLTVANNSSVGISAIKVGYYINGDISTRVEETYRQGVTLPAGQLGYHYFTKKLPRENAPYTSVCGYVHVDNDNNTTNDTTCDLYLGVRDIRADSILVEYNSDTMSLVQLRGRNIGTIAGTIAVEAGYVANGDWLHPVVQQFIWSYSEPNPNLIQYMSFDTRVPRSSNGTYNLVGWVHYIYDENRSNDTTYKVSVLDYIGLNDDPQPSEEFTLEQNKPNPMNNSTTIDFYLPSAGDTRFFLVNNMGQLIKNENKYYAQGKHQIKLENLNLAQGAYYYTMEYNGQKRVKKLIVIR